MKKIKYIKKNCLGKFSLSFRDGFPENTEKYFNFPFAIMDKNVEYKLELIPAEPGNIIDKKISPFYEDVDEDTFKPQHLLNAISLATFSGKNKEEWRKIIISSVFIEYTDSKKQKIEWLYENEINAIPKEIKNFIIKVVKALEIAADEAQEAKITQLKREEDFELELQKETEHDVKGFFSRFEEKK